MTDFATAGTSCGDLCRNGHTIVFAGDLPDGKFPEGMRCSCGLTKVHYVTCPHCNVERMEFKPIHCEIERTKVTDLGYC